MNPEETIVSEVKLVLELMRKKNHDYTGVNSYFHNFEQGNRIGIGRLKSLYLRMMDKNARIETFLTTGELVVPGENILDAFRDIVGYSLLALAMIHDESQVKGLDTE